MLSSCTYFSHPSSDCFAFFFSNFEPRLVLARPACSKQIVTKSFECVEKSDHKQIGGSSNRKVKTDADLCTRIFSVFSSTLLDKTLSRFISGKPAPRLELWTTLY